MQVGVLLILSIFYLCIYGKGIPEEQLVVLSSFYRIWQEDFANVVIPEV